MRRFAPLCCALALVACGDSTHNQTSGSASELKQPAITLQEAMTTASRAIDAVEPTRDSLERLGTSLQPAISETTDAIAQLSERPGASDTRTKMVAAARDQRSFLEFAARSTSARTSRAGRSALERAREAGRRAADAYQAIGQSVSQLAGALPAETAFNIGRLRDARNGVDRVARSTPLPVAPPPPVSPPAADNMTRTFHAPSGNVACRITESSATCTVVRSGTTFAFADGSPAHQEDSSIIPRSAGSEATWGSTVTLGRVRCSIPPENEPRGVTCVDTSSSHGFEASRIPARQRVF